MIAAILLLAAPAPPPTPEAPEIVVTARQKTCEVRVADRILSDREFRARAREWAGGTPVRVVAPAGTPYMCLARIAFRLGRAGVRVVQFDEGPWQRAP